MRDGAAQPTRPINDRAAAGFARSTFHSESRGAEASRLSSFVLVGQTPSRAFADGEYGDRQPSAPALQDGRIGATGATRASGAFRKLGTNGTDCFEIGGRAVEIVQG